MASMRQFGQTVLPASFISNPKVSDQDTQGKPSKQPISLSEFLNRKLGKTSGRLLKEKPSSFGSLGFGKKDLPCERDEAGSILKPKRAFLQQFSRAVKWGDGVDVGDGAEATKVGEDGLENEQQYSRKRKKLSKFSSDAPLSNRNNCIGDTAINKKYLVVLGDDPKPRPRRKELKNIDTSAKSIYNHYANGQGCWDDDKEGIDSEEVGYKEIWEGLGSTTLGGLDWH